MNRRIFFTLTYLAQLVMVLAGLICLFLLLATIFEDGSFILGPVRGCLPLAICGG